MFSHCSKWDYSEKVRIAVMILTLSGILHIEATGKLSSAHNKLTYPLQSENANHFNKLRRLIKVHVFIQHCPETAVLYKSMLRLPQEKIIAEFRPVKMIPLKSLHTLSFLICCYLDDLQLFSPLFVLSS